MDEPSATGRRRFSPAFLVWLAGVGAIILINYLQYLLGRFDTSFAPLGIFEFLAWLIVIGLALYGFLLLSRYLLRNLFWTVGRRLFLSYLMIGVFPFFLFAVLLAAILYVIAGVASQASFRAERQASLGQLEQWSREYTLEGRKPPDSIEIYDSHGTNKAGIPQWLQQTDFSGIALRDTRPVLLVARQSHAGDDAMRSVILARPLDASWKRELEERMGMIVSMGMAKRERDGFNFGEADSDFGSRGVRWNRVVFYDITEQDGTRDWTTGDQKTDNRIFTFISNPWSNILSFYFGGATNSQIMRVIFFILVALTTSLMLGYFLAATFAAMLIFSISRAINRIEKGTQMVEQGDFSYRIKMKRHNQLGQMASSFDTMTESIGSLLSSVAEKERLQSEIQIAAEIQRNLLPKEGPHFRGVSFSAHFEPTASIGGDYYDVFNLDKTRLAVAIGDVSGHGLSTGIVMAMVKAAMTTLIEEGADEVSLFRRLNELVHRSTERRAFMTLAFTIYDLERGTIRHTNAGHLYPYLIRKGATEVISIEAPSLPLGVRSELLTRTVEFDLQDGDAIVYLSDGIIEAQNESGDPLGFEQLEGILARQVDRSPNAIRDGILQAVAAHSGTRAADDDRTVMVLRFDNFRTTTVEAKPVLAASALG